MDVSYYQVNAFSRQFNGGNPAGVCPLPAWLPDATMQAIARENNLSETAFFVEQQGGYALRWFTPELEVDLCGHATLASAHVLFSELGSDDEVLHFHTRSGLLSVQRANEGYAMTLPRLAVTPTVPPANLVAGLGATPRETYAGTDYLLVFDDAQTIREMKPDFPQVQAIDLRGVIVTAAGDEPGVDFVSRFFGSASVGIDEDPVTGSAHCVLAPYWSSRLGRNPLRAQQLSARGGELNCEVHEQDVTLNGHAVTYLRGAILL